VAAERADVETRRAAVEADRAEVARLRAAVQSEIANEERLLAQVQREQAESQSRLAVLQAESSSIAGVLRQRQAGQPQARAARGTLGYPLANPVVTSSFGWRSHPIFGDARLHAGIDLRGSVGTPVLAAGDGIVVYAAFQPGYGNVVVIDHGRAVATLYAHQSRMGVRVGQTVKRGQVIGSVGATGYATGPHLHFEVRLAGAPVDPVPWL
jgi:murein DD-endopeptidase MepM/ murein hydrolase activator NlpD